MGLKWCSTKSTIGTTSSHLMDIISHFALKCMQIEVGITRGQGERGNPHS